MVLEDTMYRPTAAECLTHFESIVSNMTLDSQQRLITRKEPKYSLWIIQGGDMSHSLASYLFVCVIILSVIPFLEFN
jgi:hypothetical protein